LSHVKVQRGKGPVQIGNTFKLISVNQAIISAISVLSFSTTDQGSERIGAWVALRKEVNPLICCTQE